MYAKYYESINSLSAYEKISSQEELDSLAKGDNLKTQRAENKIKKSVPTGTDFLFCLRLL